jgi:CRISPR-associated protein Csx10
MPVILLITAQSPLAFAERKPGAQFRESLSYVPGAAIFGALCHEIFTREGQAIPELHGIRCCNAYPCISGDEWIRPLPATAIKRKNEKETESIDSLVERVCWEQQRPSALIYAPTDDEGRPYEATGRMFYTIGDSKLEKREVYQRVLTRVAINRQRGTAEEGRLYSPMVLSEVTYNKKLDKYVPTEFLGSAHMPDSLKPLLGNIKYVGGRQTTGLGQVEVKTTDTTSETGAAIAERIDRLTKRFQEQAERYKRLGGANWTTPIADRSIFTVNLVSDAILFEHGWLPTNRFNDQMLQEATSREQYPGVQTRLLRSFTTTSTVGGWNITWQRPKPTAMAVTMGSVFVFQAAQPLNDDDYDALARLQLEGIGERRQEGYGQIRICDEFHLMRSAT